MGCVESDGHAAATLRVAGFPAIDEDVRRIDLRAFSRVDLLWASPPCLAGSAAGRRRGCQDERNGWPRQFSAIASCWPTWLLCENV